jgi:tRNA (guanine37-N1)-methyltransferase
VQKIAKAESVSMGPYVLTGGELPALTIMDAVARFIPGVLGNESSVEEMRTAARDVYTRPPELAWKGKVYKVPKVLASGHHGKIEAWKEKRKGGAKDHLSTGA